MKRDEKGNPTKSSDFVGSANLHKYFRTDHSAQHVDSPSFQDGGSQSFCEPNSLSNLFRVDPPYATGHIRLDHTKLGGHYSHISSDRGDKQTHSLIVHEGDLPVLRRCANADAVERAVDNWSSRAARTWIVFAVLVASVTADLTSAVTSSFRPTKTTP